MRRMPVLSVLLLAMMIVSTYAAGHVTAPAKSTASSPVAASNTQSAAAPVVTPVPAQPQTGEQIKWQVIAGGGTRSTSTNYIISATVGQTAAGLITSTNYKLNQGFWQNFSTSTGCCKNRRGNVDGDALDKVNLVDLSSLINYLTGGAFVPPCKEEADINGDTKINLVDLSSLINYLTGGAFVPAMCP